MQGVPRANGRSKRERAPMKRERRLTIESDAAHAKLKEKAARWKQFAPAANWAELMKRRSAAKLRQFNTFGSANRC
jgi:hypothetical protein